jgi:SAM-dependent methyltransferase
MSGQTRLFGEPDQLPESSQWWTPMWCARRIASWVSPTARVLEPAAGSGNLIAALLERGHDPALITGVERDPDWAQHTTNRFEGRVSILCADFLGPDCANYLEMLPTFDVAFGNFPYEGGQHAAFTERALDLGVPLVIGVFPHSVEYGIDRDQLWRTKAQVTRRARLPARVSYGGAHSASFETVCLKIKRRERARRDDDLMLAVEEVWVQP